MISVSPWLEREVIDIEKDMERLNTGITKEKKQGCALIAANFQVSKELRFVLDVLRMLGANG